MNEHYEHILNHIAEGAVIVDDAMNITYANTKFQLMMGFYSDDGPGHPAGAAEIGDIVLVACNKIEMEDNILAREDLKKIGVDTADIQTGDGILAVGTIGGEKGSASVKVIHNEGDDFISDYVCTLSDGTTLELQVNGIANLLRIAVGSKMMEMKYQTQNALCVLLDGKTHAIKFYQARGYTLRGENFSDIVIGHPYLSKGEPLGQSSCIGLNFAQLDPDGKCTKAIKDIFQGKKKQVEYLQLSVNALYYMISLYPLVENGHRKYCSILFNDLTLVKSLQEEIREKSKNEKAFSKIIGNSQSLKELIVTAQKLAKSKSTVLLLGESGTGKGLFAKSIHDASKRCDKPFVAVNMAAVPEQLLESELFGYVGGSFTGADKKGKSGKFISAHTGTLFLDEIAEMGLPLQAKLLQVLQDNVVYPVGSTNGVPINVRIIAATNKNLEQEISEGRFREDLYYRLNVVSLEISPLRKRKEDIRELVHHCIPKINQKIEGKVIDTDEDVMKLFYIYDWPGNVRELENIVEYGANMADGQRIQKGHLPKRFLDALEIHLNELEEKKTIKPIVEISNDAEKSMIENTLMVTKGNRTEAAKLLHIGRTTFYNKLKKYNLD